MTTEEPNKKVERLVGSTRELIQLYRTLGYSSYAHHKQWGDEDYNDEANEKKLALDGLLFDLVQARLEYGADNSLFKHIAHENAKRYVDSPWMHTPWLRTYVLVALLDAELAPLKRESTWGAGTITALFPQPWRAVIQASFPVASLGIAYLFLKSGAAWLSLIWILPVGCYYSIRSADYLQLKRLYGALEMITDEVASGYYDAGEIANRLRRWEAKGLYVHSLTYPILAPELSG
jgi:hypothetical protein